ncbi:MAG: DegT/DnrJ/EryC1/StrS family aminotransferase [Woeseiaceae bacterium]
MKRNESKYASKSAPASWPFYDEDELAAADRVLRSGKVNYWTGEECREFESEFAKYHGVRHAVALANGTLALELGLRVLGIGKGDEVIVTPRSYFASASCVAQIGATPVFADVDTNSQNITAESIEQKITSRTKALLPVHLAGWPCDMPAIMSVAAQHGLKVIEDCAQAHGARVGESPVGSFGDVAAFSFCQDKIMSTAGEGGMMLTNDSALWQRAWEYKDHGKSWERVHADDHPPGFRWLHESFGSNWRLTELQAAIGRIQLGKLDEWVNGRRKNADRLRHGLRHLSLLRIPQPTADEYHAYYKFYAFVRPERLKSGWSRDGILVAMKSAGIPGLSGSCPEIYREKAFARQDYVVLPVAKTLGETSIMFMVHPTLAETDIDNVVDVVSEVCAAATA